MYEKQLPSGMRLELKENQTIIENCPESLGVIENFAPGLLWICLNVAWIERQISAWEN